MNAIALALPTPLPAAKPVDGEAAAAMPVAGLQLLASCCVEQTAELLRQACRRGQLDDASAAARIALPLAVAGSPHEAMLQALAVAQPTLTAQPEERRIYLLRQADGRSLGVLRLRESGRVTRSTAEGADRWQLRDGNLELCDVAGTALSRFVLCGEHDGMHLYLGSSLVDGRPQLLQEQRCTYARLSLLDPELVDPFCSLYTVEAMVPAELPAGATLLLAAAHNGADRLTELLNRHAMLAFDGELLRAGAIETVDGLISPTAGATLAALRAKDAPWFVRMVIGRAFDRAGRDRAALRARGFTLTPAHSQAALDWAIAEPALRIVHVVRSNLLAEFADVLAQASASTDALPFEPERFGRFIEMRQRQRVGLRARLMQRNADSVEVDGSRLNANTIAELTAFLTDTPYLPDPLADGDAAPTSTRRVIERFDNPALVMACLHALGRPGWAEVEGQVPDGD